MPNNGKTRQPLSRAFRATMKKAGRFLWKHRKAIARFIFFIASLIRQHSDG